MDTESINKCLKNVSNYRGCVAADMLPLSACESDCYFVVNTDVAAMAGEHWCVVGVRKGLGFFFSSYGNPPTETRVRSFLNDTRSWCYSCKRLQSLTASTCGMYCVILIILLEKGISLQHFLDLFDESDPKANDSIIQSLFEGVVTQQYKSLASS